MDRLIQLTFLGDMLCEREQIAAIWRRRTRYDVIFDQVKHLWADSDYVIGNLETPVAGKKLRYTFERMRFNAPDEFARAIKNAGIDMVSTANNHALDRGVEGVNRTIETLDCIGLEHTGSYLTREASEEIFYKEIGGIRFAFVACTYGANQGLGCNHLSDEELWRVEILKYPKQQITTKAFLVKRFLSNLVPWQVKKIFLRGRCAPLQRMDDSVDVEEFDGPQHRPFAARALNKIRVAKGNADVVVVLPHIGGQHNAAPGPWQLKMTKAFVDAGADLVVANHAHVPLGVEKMGEALVAHCLGNFCFMPTSATRQHGRADYSVLLNCWFDPQTKKLVRQDYVLTKTLIRGDGVAVPVPTKERWLDWHV